MLGGDDVHPVPPLSLHNGENLVHDQGIYTCHETLRF